MALVTGSLTSSTNSAVINVRGPCRITLSGTWAGTAKLQRRRRGAESTWVDVTNPHTDTAYSWTANVATQFRDDVGGDYRINLTFTSGTLVYDLESLH